ncbi:glycosyl hydrolase family 18 protein [Anaerosinus massiliensis]|uniref:glycosyl hydrolase family 18 protein n=1 Tax=Massilibacillus massiliensis TaxID=1806837 RepID=UPI000A5AFBDC|nr:glycosyl hydrolase family 18 protein [Massilibacillus massiliensis]
MKKRFILLMLVSFIFGCADIGQANALPKAIVIHDGENAINTEQFVRFDQGEDLIPVDVLQAHIYSNMRLDEKEKQVKIKFSLPRVRFEDAAFSRKFFSSTTFSLPYKMIEGQSYVDREVAEKILGFTSEADEETVKISMNQYSSFNPRILTANERLSLAGQKINLVWQPTFEEKTDITKTDKIEGLNVVSPSWFEIVAEDGAIRNKASIRYVKDAHERGYQVWALITNSFDPDLTKSVLHNERARQNVIKQLALYVSLYQLDGINLDFENIYDEDKDQLTEFVQEITETLHKLHAKVSIDVTIPSGVSQWSACYDRTGLAKNVDYVMLMAYDEHWRSSPISGSVASIQWVENGVQKTLKDVPAEKLVLGVPFYMREWEENFAGQKTNVKTMTMEMAEQTIQKYQLQPQWLPEKGQYYFEYIENGKKYRVWQEDERSMALKVELVNRYHLAGLAAWRRGFEKQEIWQVIEKGLKENPVAEIKQDTKK